MNGNVSRLFTSRSPFSFPPPLRLEGADFSIFHVVAKKGYCSTPGTSASRGAGAGTRLGSQGGGGWSRPQPRGFFISVRSAKVLISGKPSADEIVSCFELFPFLANGIVKRGGRILGREGGRGKMNRGSPY